MRPRMKRIVAIDSPTKGRILCPIGDCPRCRQPKLFLPPYEQFNSLSRADNKTYICPDCGTAEALEDYAGRDRT